MVRVALPAMARRRRVGGAREGRGAAQVPLLIFSRLFERPPGRWWRALPLGGEDLATPNVASKNGQGPPGPADGWMDGPGRPQPQNGFLNRNGVFTRVDA